MSAIISKSNQPDLVIASIRLVIERAKQGKCRARRRAETCQAAGGSRHSLRRIIIPTSAPIASGCDKHRCAPRPRALLLIHFGRFTATLIARSQMKSTRICIALVVILAPCSFSGQATPQPKQSEIDTANRLFQVGKFAEAGKLYSRMAAKIPRTIRQPSSWVALPCYQDRTSTVWIMEVCLASPGLRTDRRSLRVVPTQTQLTIAQC